MALPLLYKIAGLGSHKKIRCGEVLLVIHYLIKVVIKHYKDDEFIGTMRSLSKKIRKEQNCVRFELYRDMEKDNAFTMVGVWKSRKAMEKHFLSQNYKVMVGAAKVLGESYEMKIAELLEKDGLELVRDLSSPKSKPDTG